MNLSALSAKCPSSIENAFMDLILVAGLSGLDALMSSASALQCVEQF